MFFILALIPFIFFITFIVLGKIHLSWISFLTLIICILISVFFWRILPSYLIGSLIKGFLVALDIFFIIFGAIFFLEITRETGILHGVSVYLEGISKDLRVQVIFLAWFFENFLEGTAGFGTPSSVVAPILIGLGLSPIKAVIIALMGNSASTVFGAAGTPIKVGLSGLGMGNIALNTSFFNIVGFLVPVFMLWFLVAKKENGKKLFFEALPFAAWSGMAFVIVSIACVFIGQEFPSIIGAVIGLFLVLFTTKLGIFIPKNIISSKPIPKEVMALDLKKVVFPYALLIGLLVIGKFILGTLVIILPLLVKHSFALFNPGFAFVVVGIITVLFFKVKSEKIFSIAKISLKRTLEPFLVIVFMSSIAQIVVNSSFNLLGLPSMISFLAIYAKNMFLPLWSPFVGAFGSFLTGSATVSNLMFGGFLALAAKDLILNVDKILALAVVGGAAGNMISLADIMAAEAVVGLRHKERNILKGVIIPCLIYLLLVGIIGMLTT